MGTYSSKEGKITNVVWLFEFTTDSYWLLVWFDFIKPNVGMEPWLLVFSPFFHPPPPPS